MIRWPNRTLPQQTQRTLDKYQQAIDAIADYDKRVERAATDFAKYNRKGDSTFDAIKNALTKMCSGAQRCAYCEDSAADEVEHIKPKNLYPEAVFMWLNYIYACGPCNGPKNNQYAVRDPSTGKLVDVTRKRKDPVVPPKPGAAMLIDPRSEDPCDFMSLDLRSTFWFVPRTKPGTVEYERATYTIKTLRLNIREYLPQARQQAFLDYQAQLKQYRADREQGASLAKLRTIEKHIRGRGHPTVWSEMKRQHDLIPSLKKLFGDVPEALRW
jgi:uncharacterized protein (TIGR02646 family)